MTSENPLKVFREHPVASIVALVFGGFVVAAAMGGVGILKDWIWFDRGSVTLPFQVTGGCKSGYVRNLLNDGKTVAANGAENLIICDTDVLTSTEANQFKDLAALFKGCLKYMPLDTPELRLLRSSEAVCSLPGKSMFVCDGRLARKAIGGEGADSTPPDCDPETLKRFGF